MVLREDCEIKLMSLCVCVCVGWRGGVNSAHTSVCVHACVSSTDLLCFLCSATHGARRSRRSFMTQAPNED